MSVKADDTTRPGSCVFRKLRSVQHDPPDVRTVMISGFCLQRNPLAECLTAATCPEQQGCTPPVNATIAEPRKWSRIGDDLRIDLQLFGLPPARATSPG